MRIVTNAINAHDFETPLDDLAHDFEARAGGIQFSEAIVEKEGSTPLDEEVFGVLVDTAASMLTDLLFFFADSITDYVFACGPSVLVAAYRVGISLTNYMSRTQVLIS